MDSIKLVSRLLALILLGMSSQAAFCQDRPIIVSEQFLPTLSQVKEVMICSPKTYPSKKLKWFTEIDHDSPTDFLRLHFRVNEIPHNSHWEIRILKEEDAREIQTLTAKDFSNPSHLLDAWSKRVFGKTALVELIATGGINGFELLIDKYNYQVATPAVQAFIGEDDREDLVTSYGRDHRFYKWGIPVASILFVSSETKKESGCTGFLISKDLLMTNQHCVSQEWQIPTVQVIFGYETDSQKIQQFDVSELPIQSQQLDYTVLRLSHPAEGWGIVSVQNTTRQCEDEKKVDTNQRSRQVCRNQDLVLIQSPPAERKKIAVAKCKVQFVSAKGVSDGLTDFYHLCDSEGGSSGSPLMDSITGHVVGLHHAGQYDPDTLGDYHNLGVHIDRILSDIASRRSDLCKQITGCEVKVVAK
jgi:hypothetical protein